MVLLDNTLILATALRPDQLVIDSSQIQLSGVPNPPLRPLRSPGEITEAIVNYQPDMKAIAESAKKFGTQLPDVASISTPPLVRR